MNAFQCLSPLLHGDHSFSVQISAFDRIDLECVTRWISNQILSAEKTASMAYLRLQGKSSARDSIELCFECLLLPESGDCDCSVVV